MSNLEEKMSKSIELYKRAKEIIPGGTQLLSKRPEMWLPELWPSYYSKAKGCEVWDLDNNHYYDFCIMGVGANVLGYAFDEVDDAVKEAITNGSMCTLNAPEEVELAEKLLELHPWAQSVRYAKAGGEAMAMAARIARAYTKKDIVLVCGYHGWHDWYLSANLVKGDPLADVHLKGLEPAGVPQGLAGSNLIFHYNDIDEFKNLIAENEGKIAAVIMEPIRNDYPVAGYLEEIRKITAEENIVLVFDEITAGFRLCAGGSHKVLGVNPDMAIFAKGMTNGYPVSAVIGKKEIMQASQDTFISSTFWTERVGFAGAVKSIDCYIKYNVASRQKEVGEKISAGWKCLADKHGLKIHISGILPLIHFGLDDVNALVVKTFFTQEMFLEGFLAGTGVYASFAHTDEIIEKYLEACDRTFEKIAGIINRGEDVKSYLKGPVCHAGFERLN